MVHVLQEKQIVLSKAIVQKIDPEALILMAGAAMVVDIVLI